MKQYNPFSLGGPLTCNGSVGKLPAIPSFNAPTPRDTGIIRSSNARRRSAQFESSGGFFHPLEQATLDLLGGPKQPSYARGWQHRRELGPGDGATG